MNVRGRFLLIFVLIAAGALTTSAPRGEELVAPELKFSLDIPYGPAPGSGNKLDVFWPGSGGPYPVIVYFHGGGWALGDKMLYLHWARMLAQSGFTVVNANYRLSGDARFPAAVNDCLGAVIWAKEHAAQYNGDPARVAVMGDSAGAHLSAMVTLAWDQPIFSPTYPGNGHTTAQPQAAVLQYGGYRMDWIYKNDPKLWGFVSTRPLVWAFIGAPLELAPEKYREASPATYLGRKDIPPTFILCGMADTGYPESKWMYDQLNQRGARVKALFVPRASHSFNYLEDRRDFPYLVAIIEFLRNALGPAPVETAGPNGH